MYKQDNLPLYVPGRGYSYNHSSMNFLLDTATPRTSLGIPRNLSDDVNAVGLHLSEHPDLDFLEIPNLSLTGHLQPLLRDIFFLLYCALNQPTQSSWGCMDVNEGHTFISQLFRPPKNHIETLLIITLLGPLVRFRWHLSPSVATWHLLDSTYSLYI